MYVVALLGAIMILVFVHEMGHFLAAKLFRMRVERFSVGFPPKVVGKQIGETEYVIGATPLGGYVKISGMVDESMDTDFANSEPQPWEFRAKPVWQRIVVITAGVIFNFILAAFIYSWVAFAFGEDYIPAKNIKGVYVQEGSPFYELGIRTGDRIVAVNGKPLDRLEDLLLKGVTPTSFSVDVEREGQVLTLHEPEDFFSEINRRGRDAETIEEVTGMSYWTSLIGGVTPGGPADSVGLRRGDRITSIGGTPVRYWGQLKALLGTSEGRPVAISWSRVDSLRDSADPTPDSVGSGAVVYNAMITPRTITVAGGQIFGIGVELAYGALAKAEFGFVHNDLGFGRSIAAGFGETWQKGKLIATGLLRVFTGRDNFRESVGGPIQIAGQAKRALDLGLSEFWKLVAFLSITLGIVNILPIPALDGGHLMFLIYEGITRREPSLRLRIALQNVGMIVLLAFMVFVIFNDIVKL
ncbi:MAG: RIP metalloprotease RseP [Bacteroidetes bacterium]|nr:RIP metalloprotease RseP [Bacteroidota bacterium]